MFYAMLHIKWCVFLNKLWKSVKNFRIYVWISGPNSNFRTNFKISGISGQRPGLLNEWMNQSIIIYEWSSTSNENQCIRLIFFTIYIQVKCTLCMNMSSLRTWHHCNLWHHRLSNGNDLQHQRKQTYTCIADNTKIGFQILKQIKVTGGQAITVCWVIWLYEARVMNSLLCNHRLVDWTAVLALRQGVWGSHRIIRNALPDYLKNSTLSLSVFRNQLKHFLFSSY